MFFFFHQYEPRCAVFLYNITMITVNIIENKCYSNDGLGDQHLA